MPGNSFGNLFKLTTYGESHGAAIGGIIDGCPAGFEIDFDAIQNEMNRRKPGQSKIVSQRKESDKVVFKSGIFEGFTTGTPIGFEILNNNAKSKDYSHIKDVYRPSHADYTYQKKYGIRDYRGGGRSSARETACRVVAGAIAKQILSAKNIQLYAYTHSIGSLEVTKNYQDLDFSLIESNIVRCPDLELANKMEQYISEIRKKGDTIGGCVFCVIKNLNAGIGEPVFDKLQAQLAKAMLSINAVKGFEYGSGFEGTKMLGSQHNDIFNTDESTQSNYSGGIQGGISNGMDIYFKVGFKPVATIMQKQNSINQENEKVVMQGKGRHDPCVVPRAIPIVEAMAAMTLLDSLMIQQAKK
ncbi:MAG: chorismate synthase [Bacteroidota bacterium]